MAAGVMVRIAGTADIPEIAALMHAHEEHPWFAADNEAFVERHLASEGMILLAGEEESGAFLGFLILRFPGGAADNLGRDLPVPSSELGQCVHMESMIVSEAARGRGIGTRLVEEGVKAAGKKSALHAFATVHPDNLASLKSLEKNGFERKKQVLKYGGQPRIIMYRKL